MLLVFCGLVVVSTLVVLDVTVDNWLSVVVEVVELDSELDSVTDTDVLVDWELELLSGIILEVGRMDDSELESVEVEVGLSVVGISELDSPIVIGLSEVEVDNGKFVVELFESSELDSVDKIGSVVVDGWIFTVLVGSIVIDVELENVVPVVCFPWVTGGLFCGCITGFCWFAPEPCAGIGLAGEGG